MVHGITLFLLLVFAVPAMAANTQTVQQLCQDLVAYQPSDDVNYKEGTDVNGNAVAPADLPTNTQPIQLPELMHIAITVDQAQKLGLPANIPYKAEAAIGDVTFDRKTGDVYFNGKRINQPQLQVLCKEEKK